MFEGYLGTLKRSPLFANFETDELIELLKCINPPVRKYRKGEMIVMEGNEVPFFIFPLEGRMILSNERIDGNRIIDLAQEGIPYGVVSYFSGGGIWISSIEALTDCTVMLLPCDVSEITGMTRLQSAKIMKNLMRIIGKLAFQLNVRLNIFSFRSTKQKIAYYLMGQYDARKTLVFNIPMNQNELAEFLNVSRPSLTKELGEMKKENMIDYYKNSISIKNLKELKKWADEGAGSPEHHETN